MGNGIADDSAAVKAALAAVPDESGAIFFPVGSYLLRQQLVIDKSVVLR